jgi:putative redox protein
MQEKVTFKNRDGQQLAGVIHRPDAGPMRASALFAHCFTCTKNILAAVNIADALAAEGIAVLRFDFTGLGDSDGDFSDTDFSANVQDLLDAAAFMAGALRAPDILVGHSLGGTAVLAAAADVPSAVAVATIGSPAEAEHVLHLIDEDIETIEQQGEAQVRLAGRPFRIKRQFVENVRTQKVRDGVRSLRRALLVMHSPVDELVSIDEASRIYSSALHPKSFVSLDKADHLLTRKADSVYAGKLLASWAERYIPVAEQKTVLAAHVPGAVLTEAALEDGFLVSINADGHLLVGDEPLSYGGTNLGPSPYGYLSAALGACTAMTLNFFARRESIPLQHASVEVRHDHIHAKDCASCASTSGRLDRFSRRIALQGELDEEQRALLLKIADRCPVHKALHKEVLIETELLPASAD